MNPSVLFTVLALSSPMSESAPAQSLGSCTLSGTLTVVNPTGAAFEPDHAEVYVDTAFPLAPRQQEHLMLQRARAFFPRVLVVEKDDTVLFKNEDREPHEIHADKDKNTFVSGQNLKPETFRQAFQEVGESFLGCRIHAQMSGVILTVPNSFHVKVGKDGKWSISGLPNKPIDLVFWEHTGTATVTQRRRVTPCDTQSIDVKIQAGANTKARPYGGVIKPTD